MTSGPEVVRVTKVKRPHGRGSWAGYLTAHDEWGWWVFTPAHSIYLGDDGRDSGWCEVAQDDAGRGRDSIILLPTDGWFVAAWARPDKHLMTVDISTPPLREAGRFSFVDLELDPYLTNDRGIGVEDEDEFEAAVTSGYISPAERDAAQDAVERLRCEWSDPSGSLVTAGEERLRRAVRCRLPSLDASGRPYRGLRTDRSRAANLMPCARSPSTSLPTPATDP